MSVKIKICGLFCPQDADFVNEAMPDYAGFVFHPASRRYVTEERARALRAAIDPAIVTVGVFVDTPAPEIARLCREGVIGAVQLHGGDIGGRTAALRALVPGVSIWAAYALRAAADRDAAIASPADLVLLDSGGGSGRTFDWALAEGFPRPFILAGGLTPENIPDAAARLRPFAVDLSSGAESGGHKDRGKIIAAVRAARESETWSLS